MWLCSVTGITSLILSSLVLFVLSCSSLSYVPRPSPHLLLTFQQLNAPGAGALCSVSLSRVQTAYDEAITALYAGLDRAEAVLSQSRFLCGNTLTEADIRLFMTLVRFDEVYVVYFKCNVRRIIDYPALRQYCRDLFQHPGISDCINMDHIKTHYFTCVSLMHSLISVSFCCLSISMIICARMICA